MSGLRQAYPYNMMQSVEASPRGDVILPAVCQNSQALNSHVCPLWNLSYTLFIIHTSRDVGASIASDIQGKKR